MCETVYSFADSQIDDMFHRAIQNRAYESSELSHPSFVDAVLANIDAREDNGVTEVPLATIHKLRVQAGAALDHVVSMSKYRMPSGKIVQEARALLNKLRDIGGLSIEIERGLARRLGGEVAVAVGLLGAA